jgi:hypothetical protein
MLTAYSKKGQKGFIKALFWLIIILGIGGYAGNWIYLNYFSADNKKIKEAKDDMTFIAEAMSKYYLENNEWPVGISQLPEEVKNELNLISPWEEEYIIQDNNIVCHVKKNATKPIKIPFRDYSTWEYEYLPDGNPEKANPPWFKIGSGIVQYSKGALVIKDEKKAGSLSIKQSIAHLEPDHEYGLTFLTEIKVQKHSEAELFITVHDGSFYYSLCFYPDRIELRDGTRFLLERCSTKMSGRFYEIRLCVGFGKISVFKDKELIISSPLDALEGSSDKKEIIIGADISGTKTAGGSLKSFKLTTQGAHF